MSSGSSKPITLRDQGIQLGSALLMLVACACNQGPSTAPSAGIVVDGIVRGELPPANRIQQPSAALAGAEVSVLAGGATGTTTTTDANGAYRLQLPRGVFKLRWSKPGYVSIDSAETVAAESVTMSDVMLRTAPWSIAGRIADGRGGAVAGASVAIGDNGFPNYGFLTTDAGGEYRLESTSPHYTTMTVVAAKDGYEPGEIKTITCCTTEGDTRYDIRLRRIVAITINGPDTLGVGESVALPINDITLDDGSHQFTYLQPFSSDSSIVAVERGVMDQPGWGVRGVRPGTASVTCLLQHFEVQRQIQVVNR